MIGRATIRSRAARAMLALALVSALAGCAGDFRTTTTARTAEEQLLVSSSAERAIATVDARKLAGRTVFIDDAHLASVDRGYILSAFFDLCSETGARIVRSREKADVIVEVRSACAGTYDGHWTIGIPALYIAGIVAPEMVAQATGETSGGSSDASASGDASSGGGTSTGSDVAPLVEFGYVLHEGWARIQCFAYERESGLFIFGWRDRWGYAHRGFSEDIYPEKTITETLLESVK